MRVHDQIIAIATACGYTYAASDNPTTYTNLFHNGKPVMHDVEMVNCATRVVRTHRRQVTRRTENVKGLKSFIEHLPDYTKDLNAMHEAEKLIGLDDLWKYRFTLEHITNEAESESRDRGFRPIHATAAQRAEALIKILDLKPI